MSNKITDMLISAIIKKGVLGEARNVDVEFDIPTEKLYTLPDGDVFKTTKMHIKVEHMSIQFDKGNVGA